MNTNEPTHPAFCRTYRPATNCPGIQVVHDQNGDNTDCNNEGNNQSENNMEENMNENRLTSNDIHMDAIGLARHSVATNDPYLHYLCCSI
jgi:hypothetical protein